MRGRIEQRTARGVRRAAGRSTATTAVLVAALVGAAGTALAQGVVPGGPMPLPSATTGTAALSAVPPTSATTAAPAPSGATAVAGGPTAAGGGAGRRYVALGDSWAAGATMITSVDPASGSCRRSTQAYPAIVGPGLAGPAWTSRACADDGRRANGQLDALGADTEVVTVSVGADAIGLGTLAQRCGALGDATTCDAAAARTGQALAALPAALDSSLAQLRAKAPAARVAVVGVPVPHDGVPCPNGAPDAPRAARVDDAAMRLDAVLAERATAAGMTWVDVRDAFRGHGVCGTVPWLAPFTMNDPLLAAAPLVAGHALGLVPVIADAIDPAARPTGATPAPSPLATVPLPTAPLPTMPAPTSVPPNPGTANPGAPGLGTPTAPDVRSADGLLSPLLAG